MAGDEKSIEVYVELAGKEKYHQSLKGRDEDNQHPISAITNLEESLGSINEKININKENISELSASTNTRFLDFENTFNEFKQEIKTETTQKITEVADELQQEIDNIDLTDYYTKDEIDEKSEGMFIYKGQVPDFESLPMYQNRKGDVYNVSKTGANYVWTGYAWDNLSPTLCLKGYATKDYVDGSIETSVRLLRNFVQQNYYDKDQIDDKFDQIIHFDPSILESVLVYKGTETQVSRLPMHDNKVGDFYVITSDNSKYFWNGLDWTKLAEDLADKVYKKEEVDALLESKADKESTYVREQIDSKLQELNDTLTAKTETVKTELTNDITQVNDNLTVLIQELSNRHDEDTLRLARGMADLGNHISILKNQTEENFANVAEELTNIHQDIADTNTTVRNNKQEVDVEISRINTDITELDADITKIDTEMSEVIDNISDMQSDIVRLNNVTTGLDNKINEVKTNLEERIEQIEEGTSEEIEELRAEVNTRITEVKADLSELEAKVDDVSQWHKIGE